MRCVGSGERGWVVYFQLYVAALGLEVFLYSSSWCHQSRARRPIFSPIGNADPSRRSSFPFLPSRVSHVIDGAVNPERTRNDVEWGGETRREALGTRLRFRIRIPSCSSEKRTHVLEPSSTLPHSAPHLRRIIAPIYPLSMQHGRIQWIYPAPHRVFHHGGLDSDTSTED